MGRISSIRLVPFTHLTSQWYAQSFRIMAGSAWVIKPTLWSSGEGHSDWCSPFGPQNERGNASKRYVKAQDQLIQHTWKQYHFSIRCPMLKHRLLCVICVITVILSLIYSFTVIVKNIIILRVSLTPRPSAKGRSTAGWRHHGAGWGLNPLPEQAVTVPQGSCQLWPLGFQFWFSEELLSGSSQLGGESLIRLSPLLAPVSLLAGLASLGRGHGMRGSRMKMKTCTQFQRAGFFGLVFCLFLYYTVCFCFILFLFIFLAALRDVNLLTKD